MKNHVMFGSIDQKMQEIVLNRTIYDQKCPFYLRKMKPAPEKIKSMTANNSMFVVREVYPERGQSIYPNVFAICKYAKHYTLCPKVSLMVWM